MSPLLLLSLAWAEAPTIGPEPPPAAAQAFGPAAPAKPPAPGTAAPVDVSADVTGQEPATKQVAVDAGVLEMLKGPAVASQEGGSLALDSWLSASETADTPAPFSWWIAPLGMLAVGALLWSRKRKGIGGWKEEAACMKVLARRSLTPQSSLVLLEVETHDGESRRLLIGVGDAGPTLVSDLGGEIPGFLIPEVHAPELHAQPQAQPAHRLHASVEVEEEPAPRSGASRAAVRDVYSIPRAPKPYRKGASARFTDADFAPIDEDPKQPLRPVVQAWQAPPSAPRTAAPPRVAMEVDKQEYLSTRDLMGRRF